MAVTCPLTSALRAACWLALKLPNASTVGCQVLVCATVVETVWGGLAWPLIALPIMVFLKPWNATTPPTITPARMSMMIMRLVVPGVIACSVVRFA